MQLVDPQRVKRVAIIGTGTIGASWAAHFLEHFGNEIEGWWRDMREVSLTDENRDALARAVQHSQGERDVAAIAAERDTLLLATMETLARVRRQEGYD